MLTRIYTGKHETQFKIYFGKRQKTYFEEKLKAKTANPKNFVKP